MKYVSLILTLVTSVAWAQPEWVNNIEIDPDSYIGIGIGDSLFNAKLDAKNQIASSIRSTHTFAISKVVKTNALTTISDSYSKVESSAYKVLLPEVLWLHIEENNGLYYVMGKAQKIDLVTLYERQLAVTASNYSKQVTSDNLSLKDYLKLISGRDDILLAAERASIIYGESSKGKQFYAQFISLIEKTNKYNNKTCFNVDYKGHSSFERKVFKPMVEKALASSGMTVSNSSSCELVRININSEVSKANGLRTDKIKLFVELGVPRVASKTIAFVGNSSGSKKASFLNASDNFSHHFNYSNPFMSYLLDDSKQIYFIK
jgi:hypothetical protein